MEIYNERLRDLFDFDSQKSSLNSAQNSGKNLKIREHPNKGIYVQNLKQFSVNDLGTTVRYLNKGNLCRWVKNFVFKLLLDLLVFNN